jgi:hypothetical protein
VSEWHVVRSCDGSEVHFYRNAIMARVSHVGAVTLEEPRAREADDELEALQTRLEERAAEAREQLRSKGETAAIRAELDAANHLASDICTIRGRLRYQWGLDQ